MATEDARYRQSSQYRLWSFSHSHLQSLREKTNSLAVTHISGRLRASSPPVDPLPDFLTPAEEAMLLNFYIVDLLRAAQFCDLPSEIQATAAIFFRRFYVTNSLMTYPPRALTMTCIFFACKAEGLYYRLQKFADKFPGITGEEVLAAEYVLCQGLRFAFDVRHPYRALEGAIMELRRLGDFDENRLARAHQRTRDILKFSPLLTDAYFHYTPSQVMFGALSIADEGLLQRLLRDAFVGQAESAINQVLGTIQECRVMLEKEPPERRTTYWDASASKETMKPLNKKLKKCRDPDRVDLVALQKARREQGLKKVKPKVAVKDDGDVFGPSSSKVKEEERDVKRRKVVGGGDMFGPPL
ncbi:putative cyclin ccl1 [Rosellinia necatrix]|uniref:Putative cyclin ccl1 n=1 Tax=Rosellinia necatrix TaxID=77044 RepID=A0A1S8A766_ROSNE|nr:putative cyclin ccl1 [Rosellinia necatrix]